MAELQYKLMTSAVNNFDCGNPAINEYVENSYFATLLQQCYAYEIEYKSLVVGYYMITFRDVAFYDCISEISDYQIVSAKYCYVTHELRLHQNDRCKRFTLF